MAHSLILAKYAERIQVLYETPHFAVIDKPAGIPCHPARNSDVVSIEEMLTPQQRGGPWLAHRLDRDTEGCLLIAKRKSALIEVQSIWSSNNRKQIKKTYWALVSGTPKQASGIIDNKLYKVHESSGQWHMEVSHKKDAQHARTEFSILKKFVHPTLGEVTLLELNLLTGRTHQARIHCAEIGTPILGDKMYGSKIALPRFTLSAHHLEINLKEEKIVATSSLSPSFLEMIPQFSHQNFKSYNKQDNSGLLS